MIEEQEYKLKESINELIQTEKTYTDRLHTILDVFRIKLKAYIDDNTDLLIFGSIEALIKCNDTFLKDLYDDYVTSLLNHLSKFETSYSKYCNQHAKAIEAINTIQDDRFKDAILELVKEDTRCNGLDLQSFLLEPIQRIARYPLLIKQIIHYSTDEKIKGDLVKALQTSEQLLFKVNEGIRDNENRNKLDSIKINGLQVSLTGQTRFLGQRLLRHQGILIKAKSKKKLQALLLTDMLVLLLPSQIDSNKNSYDLYRNPIPLDTLRVRESEPARVPFLGDPRLCMEITMETDKPLIVMLSSPQERSEWINELRNAVNDYQKKRIVTSRPLKKVTRVVGTLAIQITKLKKEERNVVSCSECFVLNLTLNTQIIQTQVIAPSTKLTCKPCIMSVASLDEVLSLQLYQWHQLKPAEYMADIDIPLSVLEYYADKWTEEMELDMGEVKVMLRMLYRSIN